MKNLVLFFLMGLALLACDEEKFGVSCDNAIEATVRDLSGLDGCGFVFVLDDGTKLQPGYFMFYCGTPPLPKEVTEDPLYQFEWIDGKRVKIGYEEFNDYASNCMAAQMVKITCIEELGLEPTPTPQD